MKIFSDEKLIKRNKVIGNVLSLGSLAILAIGMFLSFKDKAGNYLPYTFASLIVGFLLFQVGNFYMAKWGKSPRPDELISQSLKGLDGNYSLYHYKTSVSHLLVGPSGVFAILPYNQPGLIEFNPDRNRWKQSGGNFFLKTFGGESLGRPDLDAKYASLDLEKLLAKINVNVENTNLKTVMVFTSPKAELISEGSEIPAIPIAKLKDYIRKQTKSNLLSPEIINQINLTLGT
jgi:hypothetical protein